MKKLILLLILFISNSIYSIDKDCYQIDSMKYKLSENTNYTDWESAKGEICIDYKNSIIIINSIFYKVYKYDNVNHFVTKNVISIDDFYSSTIILSIYSIKNGTYFLIDDTKNKTKYYFKINKK